MLFLLSMSLSVLLAAAISMLMYVLVFKTINLIGSITLFGIVSELFSGQLMPIPLMPKAVQIVCNFLPFRYLSDLPFRIYTGNINISDGFMQIGWQVCWLIAIIIIGSRGMKKSLEKVVVFGG